MNRQGAVSISKFVLRISKFRKNNGPSGVDTLVNLPVAPDDKALNVKVTSSPEDLEPRQDVTFHVLVTDNQGAPFEGEFSLAVVDQASLALADPNSEDILSAYYSNQPLGIETGLSIAAYTGRDAIMPGGMGGGGGGELPFIRENFPDTAYWNPSLITNSDGRGQVTVTLPDSLTTWQVDVRGLTVDTRVGEMNTEVVSTKPLLVRPVTPRFLVSGDHVQMAAIINNNTSDRLTVLFKSLLCYLCHCIDSIKLANSLQLIKVCRRKSHKKLR